MNSNVGGNGQKATDEKQAMVSNAGAKKIVVNGIETAGYFKTEKNNTNDKTENIKSAEEVRYSGGDGVSGDNVHKGIYQINEKNEIVDDKIIIERDDSGVLDLGLDNRDTTNKKSSNSDKIVKEFEKTVPQKKDINTTSSNVNQKEFVKSTEIKTVEDKSDGASEKEQILFKNILKEQMERIGAIEKSLKNKEKILKELKKNIIEISEAINILGGNNEPGALQEEVSAVKKQVTDLKSDKNNVIKEIVKSLQEDPNRLDTVSKNDEAMKIKAISETVNQQKSQENVDVKKDAKNSIEIIDDSEVRVTLVKDSELLSSIKEGVGAIESGFSSDELERVALMAFGNFRNKILNNIVKNDTNITKKDALNRWKMLIELLKIGDKIDIVLKDDGWTISVPVIEKEVEKNIINSKDKLRVADNYSDKKFKQAV